MKDVPVKPDGTESLGASACQVEGFGSERRRRKERLPEAVERRLAELRRTLVEANHEITVCMVCRQMQEALHWTWLANAVAKEIMCIKKQEGIW